MNNKSDTDPFAARIDGQPTAAEIRLNADVVAALSCEAELSRVRMPDWKPLPGYERLIPLDRSDAIIDEHFRERQSKNDDGVGALARAAGCFRDTLNEILDELQKDPVQRAAIKWLRE